MTKVPSFHINGMTPSLSLAFSVHFSELHQQEGLCRLDGIFCEWLASENPEAAGCLAEARQRARAMPAGTRPSELSKEERSAVSDAIILLAPYVEQFIGQLFTIDASVKNVRNAQIPYDSIHHCKREFVQRRALRHIKPEEAMGFDSSEVTQALESSLGQAWDEALFAERVTQALQAPEDHVTLLEAAANYAAWALFHPEGKARHRHSLLFHVPAKTDWNHRVPGHYHGQEEGEKEPLRFRVTEQHERHGFGLTDAGVPLGTAVDQAHYCIICHKQHKDSCSKGMAKDGVPMRNPLGVVLEGCPLEEHISEMNYLKSQGSVIGALATAMIQNPLLAATGHRICNDCMRSCIYQRQEPVDIPRIESRILQDVLDLPWGFEVYSLLTRWNPLHFERPLPRALTQKHVLVVGMGPAGFSLAHHLLNEGHHVTAIDGLKIEPLPPALHGRRFESAEQTGFEPIYDIKSIYDPLDERVAAGFGGVAEYGITVRWNKNYLTLIRLLLERRAHFQLFGGIRFGGTLTAQTAFSMGFDHIALAVGAGKPTLLSIPNGLARGVRTASDFLMALQLTGAFKRDSLANLQVRLPVIVIGGGLTALDTATEALAYYPVQVTKFYDRYQQLSAAYGEEKVRAAWNSEERSIADEWLAHAEQLYAEDRRAHAAEESPSYMPLLRQWGGVTIAYRRTLQDAPSYRHNHEEVALGLAEGIEVITEYMPLSIECDEYGHVKALHGSYQGRDMTIAARTILVAAGTHPNTSAAQEDPYHFQVQDGYFAVFDAQGNPAQCGQEQRKSEAFFFTYCDPETKQSISFLGDAHPAFAGNVVKAMASALYAYPSISAHLASMPRARDSAMQARGQAFQAAMHEACSARVQAVTPLAPGIVELVIHAPLAARQFEPGQFYRLQNYEHYSPQHGDAPSTRMAMEGMAMTGAWVDKEKGIIGLIILEMGGSSSLCRYLRPGEPVVLMGPTGTPTDIPRDKKVVLVGGGLGNAVLFSIGSAMRKAGCQVVYVAGYRTRDSRFMPEHIEEAADQVIWCADDGLFAPRRPGDALFHGSVIEALEAYAKGAIGPFVFPLEQVDHLIAIGSDGMMKAVANARHRRLKAQFSHPHVALGSINSPMQCMMKEICAQCVQRHIDPVTLEEYYVYSCVNQDQPLDRVDFDHLRARLTQNGVAEKLTAQWIEHCLRKVSA